MSLGGRWWAYVREKNRLVCGGRSGRGVCRRLGGRPFGLNVVMMVGTVGIGRQGRGPKKGRGRENYKCVRLSCLPKRAEARPVGQGLSRGRQSVAGGLRRAQQHVPFVF